MGQPTVTVLLKVDVSPEGIKLRIDDMENDLASLIGEAETFRVEEVKYSTVDTADILIRSTKVLQFVDPPKDTPEEG